MLIRGDARFLPLRDGCVDAVVTSPPYFGLRDYGHVGQLGLEPTWETFVEALVLVFREVRRVLNPNGTAWLNLGDSYANPDKGGYQPSRVKAEDSLQRGNLASDFPGAPNRMPQTGLKSKDLLMIPARVAIALQADGWYLRSDIIWSKPNPMPESVTDRPTKAHEYLFLLTKSERYFYDAEAIAESIVKTGTLKHRAGGSGERAGTRGGLMREEYVGKHGAAESQSAGRRMLLNAKRARANGADHDSPFGDTRNRRTVWTIPTMPYAGAHFATMPEKLVEPCILAGCPLGGLVLDPFVGSGTVVAVAQRLGRRGVGVDLSYQDLASTRTAQQGLRFGA